MKLKLVCLAVVGVGVWSTTVLSQDIEVEPRALIEDARAHLALIDDLKMHGESTATSYSVSTVNGVKTTRVMEPSIRLEIVEDPAAGITCKVTKAYGPDDLAKIEEEQPELFMHLSAIPKIIGEAEIEVVVNVTKSYSAADESELKANHPEIHELFKKYTGDEARGRMRVRIGRPMDLEFFRPQAELDDDDEDDDAEVDDDDDDDDDEEDSDDDDDGDGDGR